MKIVLTPHYKYQLVSCVYFKGLVKLVTTQMAK